MTKHQAFPSTYHERQKKLHRKWFLPLFITHILIYLWRHRESRRKSCINTLKTTKTGKQGNKKIGKKSYCLSLKVTLLVDTCMLFSAKKKKEERKDKNKQKSSYVSCKIQYKTWRNISCLRLHKFLINIYMKYLLIFLTLYFFLPFVSDSFFSQLLS